MYAVIYTVGNNYIWSKSIPKQQVLEYHKMKSTILTLDGNRKKLDENYNSQQTLNFQFFTHHTG